MVSVFVSFYLPSLTNCRQKKKSVNFANVKIFPGWAFLSNKSQHVYLAVCHFGERFSWSVLRTCSFREDRPTSEAYISRRNKGEQVRLGERLNCDPEVQSSTHFHSVRCYENYSLSLLLAGLHSTVWKKHKVQVLRCHWCELNRSSTVFLDWAPRWEGASGSGTSVWTLHARLWCVWKRKNGLSAVLFSHVVSWFWKDLKWAPSSLSLLWHMAFKMTVWLFMVTISPVLHQHECPFLKSGSYSGSIHTPFSFLIFFCFSLMLQ